MNDDADTMKSLVQKLLPILAPIVMSWLANKIAPYDEQLNPGDIVLSAGTDDVII